MTPTSTLDASAIEAAGRRPPPSLEDLPQTALKEASPTLSLAQRVNNACQALRQRCASLQKRRNETMVGSVELYWLAQQMDANTKLIWKKLELAELCERRTLLSQVRDAFRRLLPQSATADFSNWLTSPGKVVVEWSRLRGQNLRLAEELLALERQKREREFSLEISAIRASNTDALVELARFESRVLEENPALPQRHDPTLHRKIGLDSLIRLDAERRALHLRTAHMEENLRKLQETVIKAIDSKTEGDDTTAHPLLQECRALLETLESPLKD